VCGDPVGGGSTVSDVIITLCGARSSPPRRSVAMHSLERMDRAGKARPDAPTDYTTRPTLACTPSTPATTLMPLKWRSARSLGTQALGHGGRTRRKARRHRVARGPMPGQTVQAQARKSCCAERGALSADQVPRLSISTGGRWGILKSGISAGEGTWRRRARRRRGRWGWVGWGCARGWRDPGRLLRRQGRHPSYRRGAGHRASFSARAQYECFRPRAGRRGGKQRPLSHTRSTPLARCTARRLRRAKQTGHANKRSPERARPGVQSARPVVLRPADSAPGGRTRRPVTPYAPVRGAVPFLETRAWQDNNRVPSAVTSRHPVAVVVVTSSD